MPYPNWFISMPYPNWFILLINFNAYPCNPCTPKSQENRSHPPPCPPGQAPALLLSFKQVEFVFSINSPCKDAHFSLGFFWGVSGVHGTPLKTPRTFWKVHGRFAMKATLRIYHTKTQRCPARRQHQAQAEPPKRFHFPAGFLKCFSPLPTLLQPLLCSMESRKSSSCIPPTATSTPQLAAGRRRLLAEWGPLLLSASDQTPEITSSG